MRERFLATPIYDVNYLIEALLEETPALANEMPLPQVLETLGYSVGGFMTFNLDDLDDPIDLDADDGQNRAGLSYVAWMRALIDLLGAHEVAHSYFRIGE